MLILLEPPPVYKQLGKNFQSCFFLHCLGKFSSYTISVTKNDFQAEFDKRGRINRPFTKSAHRIMGGVEFLFTLIVDMNFSRLASVFHFGIFWEKKNREIVFCPLCSASSYVEKGKTKQNSTTMESRRHGCVERYKWIKHELHNVPVGLS